MAIPLVVLSPMRSIGKPKPVTTPFAIWLFAASVLASTAVLRIREIDDKSLDLQTLIRLMFVFVTIATPLLHRLLLRAFTLRLIPCLWIAFTLTFVAPLPGTANLAISAIDTAALMGVLGITFWTVEQEGELAAARVLVLCSALLCFGSIAAYLLAPDLGRLTAWDGRAFNDTGRMTGILGSANGLGLVASLGLLVGILYIKGMGTAWRYAFLLSTPAFLLCLYLSNNRVGIAALLACIALWLALLVRLPAARLFLFAVFLTVAALVVLFAQPLAMMIARNEGLDDIYTLTGRADIWAVVIDLVGKRPLVGYGYGASAFILPRDPRLFDAAVHAHNMPLQILFSGGVIAFSAFILALGATGLMALRSAAIEPVVIGCYFMLRGITEPTPFGGLPNFGAYVFCFAAAAISSRGVAQRRLAQLRHRHSAMQRYATCVENLKDRASAESN